MVAKTDTRDVRAPLARAILPLLMEHWPVIILGLLATIALLWGLGQNNLRDWDEAIYSQLAKETAQSGEWLTLHYGYKPWFEKPPLFMWTTAVFYHLVGINEFWSRAASAFSGILLIMVTYLMGKLIHDRRVGFLAALTLLTSYEFIRHSRLGMTDAMFTLFVFLALYSYLRLRVGSQWWWYLLWASFGLAIMTKSWAAVILPVTILILLFVDRGVRAALRSRHFWQGMLLAFAIAAPWHILMYVRHGFEFVEEYVVYHFLARASTGIESHVGGPLFYVDVLERVFLPWFYLLPFAVALAIQDNLGGSSRSRILLILVAVVIGAYTFLVKTKIGWYIFPVYPAFAILLGATMLEAFDRHQSMAFAGLVFAALVSILIAQTTLVYLTAIAGSLIVVVRLLRFTSARQTYRLATTLMFIFLVSIGAASMVQRNYRIVGRPLYTKIEAPPVVRIARIAGSASPDQGAPLIGLALEEDLDTDYSVEGPAAQFYSDRPMQVAWTLDQLAELTNEQERKEMLLARKYVEPLSTEYELDVLAEVEPLVYATIRHRGLSGPAFSTPDCP